MKLSLIALLLAVSALCHASTTFTVNETVTLTSSAITSGGGLQTFLLLLSPANAVAVQNGDVITGTVTFTNGPVTLTSVAGNLSAGLDIFFLSVITSGDVTDSGSIDFLGLTGPQQPSTPTPLSPSQGCCLLASQETDGSALNFSFTGVTYTINVTSVSPSPDAFYFRRFDITGTTVTFPQPAAVPEASSLLLCGIGCLGLVCGLRRRQARG